MKNASPFQRANLLSVFVFTLAVFSPRTSHAWPAPTITQQPTNRSVLLSSNAIFTVVASGQTPLSYRWSFNGTNLINNSQISGATNSTLVVSNVYSGNAGNYRVVVTNSHGSATSSNAVLTVLFPPGITAQPTNQTVYVGDPVAFSVTAGGTAPLSYQWKFNGTNLTGQTNAILSMAATTNQVGNYSVVVTNFYGWIQSSNAALTVLDSAPIILTQPASQDAYIGSDLNLSVIATGSKPLSYQWQYNGNNISGATNATLTVTEMSEQKAGSYRVLVSNSAGSVFSSSAAIQVPTVVSWGYTGSTNVPAGLTNVMLTVAGYFSSWALQSDGAAAVWSTGWTAMPTTGVSNLVQAGIGANFALGLQADGKVLFWGCNCNGEGNLPPDLTNCISIATGDFHGLAFRADGTVAVWGPNWYGITNPPPDLTNVVSVFAGTYQSFAVRADGTVAAWGRDDFGQCDVPAGLSNVVAVTGGLLGSEALKSDGTVVAWGAYPGVVPFGISNVVAISAGLYDVLALKQDGTVVNWGGNPYGETNVPPGLTNVLQIGSGDEHNTVLMGQPSPRIMRQPAGTTVSLGSRTFFYAPAIGRQPLSCQWQLNGTNLPGATRPNLLLENIQKANAGNYTLIVTNSFGSVTSAVATLNVNLPPTITGQPQDQTVIVSNSASFSVSVEGTPPLGCRWYFNGNPLVNNSRVAGSTTTNLTISNVQTSDAGNYFAVITNSFGSVTSTVAVLTVLVPPTIITEPQSANVAVGGMAVLPGVTLGTQPISYQWFFNGTPLANDDHVSGATSSPLVITNALPGNSGNYWFVVSNIAGMTTSSVATVSVLIPPAITLQPVSQTLLYTSSVTFTAAASGDAPLSYQWYFNGNPLVDSSRITGSTTTNLTLSDLHFADGGNYVLVVTNLVGSATSTAVMLTVVSPPEIIQQPTDRNVLVGSNAVISATVNGTLPISYQWFFNGSPLTDDGRMGGSATASLTIGSSQTNDAGGYQLIASNAYGAVTSSVANLTVWLPVSITQQPSNQTVAVGSTPCHYPHLFDPCLNSSDKQFFECNACCCGNATSVPHRLVYEHNANTGWSVGTE